MVNKIFSYYNRAPVEINLYLRRICRLLSIFEWEATFYKINLKFTFFPIYNTFTAVCTTGGTCFELQISVILFSVFPNKTTTPIKWQILIKYLLNVDR